MTSNESAEMVIKNVHVTVILKKKPDTPFMGLFGVTLPEHSRMLLHNNNRFQKERTVLGVCLNVT